MHAITTTKIIAGLMILSMLLTSVGCYTLDTVDVKDADADKDLIVRTKDRRYFWLATWKADSIGNVGFWRISPSCSRKQEGGRISSA